MVIHDKQLYSQPFILIYSVLKILTIRLYKARQ